MSPGTFESEPRHLTLAAILLVLGVLLLLFSWGSWLFRSGAGQQEPLTARASTPNEVPTSTVTPDRKSNRSRAIRIMPLVLVVTMLLTLVVLIGVVLVRRGARRYFATQSRQRASPTMSEDVWSQHRLTSEDEPQSERPCDDR